MMAAMQVVVSTAADTSFNFAASVGITVFDDRFGRN